MTISSRTPESLPHRCPVCGKYASVEPSLPAGDAVESLLADDLGVDSLEVVELVMEVVEEEYGVRIPDDEAHQIQTVEDAIRAILRQRRDGAA
jgi:acyl carrier protein